MELGKIESIEEVHGYGLGNSAAMNGTKGASLGMSGMLSILGGGRSMEGYKIKTEGHEVLVLIDDQSSCCESWGYFSTEDSMAEFIGASLIEIVLTDTALKQEVVESKLEYGLDGGGIQFVTFKTDKGDFQLAVYNAHNGYYGHGIIVAKDQEILCQDTL